MGSHNKPRKLRVRPWPSLTEGSKSASWWQPNFYHDWQVKIISSRHLLNKSIGLITSSIYYAHRLEFILVGNEILSDNLFHSIGHRPNLPKRVNHGSSLFSDHHGIDSKLRPSSKMWSNTSPRLWGDFVGRPCCEREEDCGPYGHLSGFRIIIMQGGAMWREGRQREHQRVYDHLRSIEWSTLGFLAWVSRHWIASTETATRKPGHLC